MTFNSTTLATGSRQEVKQINETSLLNCFISVKTTKCEYFLPHSPLGLSGYCFHPWCPDGQVGGQRGKVCLGCISETVKCRKLRLGSDIG